MKRTVFITGYPRQLARLIAEESLEDPEVTAVMLVRPRHHGEWGAWAQRLGERAARVEAVLGDVSSIDLGLSGAAYRALATRADVIHHAAVATAEGEQVRLAEQLNLQGTRELIALVDAAHGWGRRPRVVIQSSVRVAGDFVGTLSEADLELGQGFRGPIESSLFRAERAWRRAPAAWGVTVVRRALMVGHSVTGEVDLLDGLYVLILLLLSAPVDLQVVPLPVIGEQPLNIVPVDFVARASVALGQDVTMAGQTVHLVDPSPLPVRRVWELLARASSKQLGRGVVPVHVARALLSAPGLERLARSPRAFFDQVASRAWFGASNSQRWLRGAAIECPPFAGYAEVLVGAVRARLAASPMRRVEAVEAREADADDPLW
ncbi:MAG: SDR family oxidoreductase [Myxococcales bacterium]|nr:SDR family oxidoreductase [Myxococcales bacterium]